MIATTIEQGKRLLKAGVDPKTADMFGVFYPNVQEWHIEARDNEGFEGVMKEVSRKDEYYVCWSLSALITLCPEHVPYRIIRTRSKDIEGIFEDLVNYLCKEK